MIEDVYILALLILAKSASGGKSKTTFFGNSTVSADSCFGTLVIGDFWLLIISKQG